MSAAIRLSVVGSRNSFPAAESKRPEKARRRTNADKPSQTDAGARERVDDHLRPASPVREHERRRGAEGGKLVGKKEKANHQPTGNSLYMCGGASAHTPPLVHPHRRFSCSPGAPLVQPVIRGPASGSS
jgi:hypothetical protein